LQVLQEAAVKHVAAPQLQTVVTCMHTCMSGDHVSKRLTGEKHSLIVAKMHEPYSSVTVASCCNNLHTARVFQAIKSANDSRVRSTA